MKKWWIILFLIFVSLAGYSQQKPATKQPVTEPQKKQVTEQKKQNTAPATIKQVPKAQQNKNQIQKTQVKKKQIERTQVQRRKAAQVARRKKAVQRRRSQ